MRLDKGTLQECKYGTRHDLDFSDWYKNLGVLTHFINENQWIDFVSVNDAEVWKECYEQGQTPHEALREEYPEDKFPYYLEDSYGHN